MKRQRNNNNEIDPITQNRIPPHRKIHVHSIPFNSHGLAAMLNSGMTMHPLTGKNLSIVEQKNIINHAKRTGWTKTPRNVNKTIPSSLRNVAASNAKKLENALKRQRLSSMHNLVSHNNTSPKLLGLIESLLDFFKSVEGVVRRYAQISRTDITKALPHGSTFWTENKGGELCFANNTIGTHICFMTHNNIVDTIIFGFGKTSYVSFGVKSYGENICLSSFTFSKGDYIVAPGKSRATLLPGYTYSTDIRHYKLPTRTFKGTGLTPLVFLAAIVQGLGMHVSIPVHGTQHVEARPLFEVVDILRGFAAPFTINRLWNESVNRSIW